MLISKISGGVNNIPSDVKGHLIDENLFMNRKVLLREHKRHTAHCVMVYPSHVLGQYPISVLAGGGYPSPVMARGILQSCSWKYPSPVLAGGTLSWGTHPQLGLGYPPWPELGYPPPRPGLVYPLTRTGVPPAWKGPGTRDLGKNLGLGTPLDVDRQTPVKTLPSPSFGCRMWEC